MSQQNLHKILQTTLDKMELPEFEETYHFGGVLFSAVVEKLKKENIITHLETYFYKELKTEKGYAFICLSEINFENEDFVVFTKQEDSPEFFEDVVKPIIVKVCKKSELLSVGKDIFEKNPNKVFYGLGLANSFLFFASLEKEINDLTSYV